MASTTIASLDVKIQPDMTGFFDAVKDEVKKIEKYFAANPGEIKFVGRLDSSGISRQVRQVVASTNAANRTDPSRWVVYQSRIEDPNNPGVNNHQQQIVQVQPQLDRSALARVQAALEAFHRANTPRTIDFNFDADRLLSSIRRGFDSRPVASFRDYVVRTSRALSGFNVVADKTRMAVDKLANFDQVARVMGTATIGIMSATTAVGALAANVLSLGASIAQIGPVVLAAPGIFAGFGAAAFVAQQAITKLIERNKWLEESWDAFQTRLADSLEAGWQSVIAPNVLPWLREMGTYLESLAGVVGGSLAMALNAFRAAINPVRDHIFGQLNAAMAAMGPVLANVSQIMVHFFVIGAQYLPRFVAWLDQITSRFEAWLALSIASGAMWEWIDTGILRLQELWHVATGVWQIFAVLGGAAQEAGGMTLASLGASLHSIADSLERSRSAVVGFFSGAIAGWEAFKATLAPGLSEFWGMLVGLTSEIGPQIGRVAGGIGSAFLSGLASPEIRAGVEAVFGGMERSMPAINASFASLGNVLGMALQEAGSFLETVFWPILESVAGSAERLMEGIAPSIERIFSTLGPGLVTVLEMVSPLIEGGLIWAFEKLADVVEAVSPVVQSLVQSFVDWAQGEGGANFWERLVAGATGFWTFLQAAGSFVADLFGPAVTELFAALGSIFATIGEKMGPLGEALAQFAPVAEIVGQALGLVMAFIGWILETSIATFIEGIIDTLNGFVDIFVGLWDIVAGIFTLDGPRVWEGIKTLLDGIFGSIWGLIQIILTIPIAKVFGTILQVAVGLVGKILPGIGGIAATAIAGLLGWFTKFLGRADTILIGLLGKIFNGIVKWFNQSSSWLAGWGRLLIVWVDELGRNIVGFFQKAWDTVWKAVSGFGKKVWDWAMGLWPYWTNAFSSVAGSMKKWGEDAIAKVVAIFKTFAPRILHFVGGWVETVRGIGRSIANGLSNGVENAWDRVVNRFKSLVDLLPQAVKDLLGIRSPSRVMAELGGFIGEGLIVGMEAPLDSLVGMAEDTASALQSAFSGVGADMAADLAALDGSRVDVSARMNAQLGSADGATVKQTTLVYNASNSGFSAESDLFQAAEKLRLANLL